ncbi:MAG: UvrD-helicase domain-containing protein [Flavobacteriales bacterium AspAUS03]
MLTPAALKIYNASAGSGKTYTLVYEYLSVLLQDEDLYRFKRILAVTFTNKAAGEMKRRILQSLKSLADGVSQDPSDFLAHSLSETLVLTPDRLQYRAKAVLRTILHDYANFSVSTIDKFTYKIIRTFIPDLGFSQVFEVEMEAKVLLKESVEVFLSRLNDSEKYSQILIDFSLEKLKEGKSWDLSRDLMNIAGLLVEEQSIQPLRKIKAYSLEDFLTLHKLLKNRIQQIKSDFKSQADYFFHQLNEVNISRKSFYYSALPNFFKKLSIGSIFKEPFKEPFNKTLENSIATSHLYANGMEASQKALIDSQAEWLIAVYQASREAYFEKIPAYLLDQLLLNNLTVLAVIHQLIEVFETLKKDTNILLNAELNKLISDELHGQPLPYIYERLGECYQYYFIDEFQDTSSLQWRNLQPLIENALTKNGTVLLVGDAKQSIYRWRGGEAEQFIDLVERPSMAYRQEVDTLGTNFRSCAQIVHFNNTLYTLAAQTFDDAVYRKIYTETTVQEVIDKPGGYVELNFLDGNSTTYPEQTYQLLKMRIETLLKQGYRLDEIAILVRSNEDGFFLAQALSRDQIAFCSSESLLLKHAWPVQLLIGLFQILATPDDRQTRVAWLLLLVQNNRIIVSVAVHDFLLEMISLPLDTFFERLGAHGLSFEGPSWYILSLYDLTETFIRIFHLADGVHTAALQFFLDFVHQSMQKLGNSIPKFLEHWEDRKDKESIIFSEDLDAIRIMTIHKSKGLQFPVVLLAFADWPAFREKNSSAWIDINPQIFNRFDTFHVGIRSFMKRIDGAAGTLYENHAAKIRFDNLNLLYVATTRAIEQLIILTRDEKSKDETIAFYLRYYLRQEKLWEISRQQYSFGTPQKWVYSGDKKSLHHESIPWISEPWQDRVSINPVIFEVRKENGTVVRSSGNLVHKAFSMIRFASDLEQALQKLCTENNLSDRERLTLKKKLLMVIHHPELRDCYRPGYRVFFERELLFQGKLLRPDRVIFFPEEIVVIEYKTGSTLEAHFEQLNAYMKAILAMGRPMAKGFLVYIADEIKLIPVHPF